MAFSRIVTQCVSGLHAIRVCGRLGIIQARHNSGLASEAGNKTSPSTAYTPATHTSGTTHSPDTTNILSLASSYILPVYARPNIVLSRGSGCWVWDTEERKYLDFSSGIAVNALGHADTKFVGAMAEQAGKLSHTSNVYHNEWAARLAQLLVTLTQSEGGLGWPQGKLHSENNKPEGLKVFFANSGTEAVEGALKIARKVGKDRWVAANPGRSWDSAECTKTRIVCFENSFHGRSMGALSVTTNAKYQKPFMPLVPGVDVGRLNSREDIERLVGKDTCAVIVEPIQGEGGIHVAQKEWLHVLRKRCDEVGAILIYDEIQCGLYRTGTLWAHSALPIECHPDIVTMAKPLANGYPIGAVVLRDSIGSTMTAGTHGTTFGGSPLACYLGHHVLSRLSNRSFVAHIGETSAYLIGRLSLLPEWFPEILKDGVRGKGLILGLGFKDDKAPGQVVSMARERGVLLLTAGTDAVRLVPSLNVNKEEVDVCVDVLESCLSILR